MARLQESKARIALGPKSLSMRIRYPSAYAEDRGITE